MQAVRPFITLEKSVAKGYLHNIAVSVSPSPFSEAAAALGQTPDRPAQSWRTWDPDHHWSPSSSNPTLQTSLSPQLARQGARSPRSLYLWGRHTVQCFKPTTFKSSHSRDRTTSGSVQDAGGQGLWLKARTPSEPLDSSPSGLPSHPWGILTLQYRVSPFTWGSYNWPYGRTRTSTHLSFHFPFKFPSPTHLLLRQEADSGSVKDGMQLPHAVSGEVWTVNVSPTLNVSHLPRLLLQWPTPLGCYHQVCN